MTAKKEQTSFKKYVSKMWMLFFGALIISIIFFFGIAKGLLGEMPTFKQLENPNSFLATEILTEDEKILGKYFRENRSNSRYEDLPQNLKDALIATEDARFENHSGIDFRALVRAVFFLGKRGGASTISQQLAKNLFNTREKELKALEGTEYEYKPTILEKILPKTISAKLKEWVIAVQLEKRYTKEEVLTMYLNTVEFSDNAFGIKSASRTYFNKLPIDLNTEESAVLVGMLKAPYKYNPRANNETSKARRNDVLNQMYKYEFLSSNATDSLKALDLKIDFQKSAHTEGLAPYFREELRKYLAKWVKENPKQDGTFWDIYGDGLKIHTTLNYKMQKYAEEAAIEHLTEIQDLFFKQWKDRNPWKEFENAPNKKRAKVWTDLQETSIKTFVSRGMTKKEAEKYINTEKEMSVWSYKGNIDTTMTPLDSIMYYRMFLQTGVLAVDQKTGAIKAWVGGANINHFQYDHVNVNTKRQVGSTFKPFIYTLAIKEKGYSPCFRIPNQKVTFETGDATWPIPQSWTASNSDNKYGGSLAIQDGLKGSVNTIAAYLMHELNPKLVQEFAKKIGITSNIPPVPSVCLGTPDISLTELVGAYTIFSNNGYQSKPFFISRIEDSHGNVIASFEPEQTEALDKETAYVMTRMLRRVVDDGRGTGYRVRYRYKLPMTLEIAGKTGTTQNNSDGWFVGYTPDLLAGTWVGCEDRYVRFRRTADGQGASTALPIWAKFMNKVYADPTLGYDINAKFAKPPGDLSVTFDCNSATDQFSEGEPVEGMGNDNQWD